MSYFAGLISVIVGLFNVVLLTLGLSSPLAKVEGMTFFHPGIYTEQTSVTEAAPDTTLGHVTYVKNAHLVQPTTQIPARLGTTFGMRYRVLGSPAGAPVNLRAITRIPHPGITNPRNNTTFLTSEYESMQVIGEVNYRSYIFEEPWEIVTGIWSMEFWLDGKLVGEQKFEVVADDKTSEAPR